MLNSSPSANDQLFQRSYSTPPILIQETQFPIRKKLPIPFISKPPANDIHIQQNESSDSIKKEQEQDLLSDLNKSNNLAKDISFDLNDCSIDAKDESNDLSSADRQDIDPIDITQASSSEKKKSNRKARVPFTPEEDEKIKHLVNLYGNKHWSVIASFLVRRTPKQCRDRYTNYLVPGLFKGEWSNDEDDLLKKLYIQNGPKWSVFKNHFPGRSANSIKNRWNYFLSRQERTFSDENCGLTQLVVESKNDFSDITPNNDVMNTVFYQSCEMIDKNVDDEEKDTPEVTNLLENEILETDNIIDFTHDWYVF